MDFTSAINDIISHIDKNEIPLKTALCLLDAVKARLQARTSNQIEEALMDYVFGNT